MHFHLFNESFISVKIINDMHIKEQNRDAQGDIYEYLLGQLSTAGKNGDSIVFRNYILAFNYY